MLADQIIPGADEHGRIPEIRWEYGDDLCDCMFQRIGYWTNPYIARTLEIRLCCMWKRLNEMFPGLMREIPAFHNYNEDVYETAPRMWDAEDDMPRHMWHRQIAVITGLDLDTVRRKFAGQRPPEGKRKAVLTVR